MGRNLANERRFLDALLRENDAYCHGADIRIAGYKYALLYPPAGEAHVVREKKMQERSKYETRRERRAFSRGWNRCEAIWNDLLAKQARGE